MRTLAVSLFLCFAASAHADPAACSKPGAVATKARLTADAVDACLDDNNCWHMPLATRRWELAKDFGDLPAPPAAATVAVTACSKPNTDCHAVDTGGPNGDAATNAAHTLVAQVSAPVKIGKGTTDEQPILLYDVAAPKLVATIRGWKTPMGDPAFFRSVRFLGDTLFVAIAFSPVSSAGRLYDGKTGKKLADIGGATQEIDEGAIVELGKGTYAFGAFSGTKVFVLDVATGKTHPAIGLAAPTKTTPPPLAQLALFAKTADGATLVALRGDAASGVTLIDTKSRNGQRVAIPVCK